MTTDTKPQLMRVIAKLQKEVQRLEKYEHWIKMTARHGIFCPARKKPDGRDCTCGLNRLDPRFK